MPDEILRGGRSRRAAATDDADNPLDDSMSRVAALEDQLKMEKARADRNEDELHKANEAIDELRKHPHRAAPRKAKSEEELLEPAVDEFEAETEPSMDADLQRASVSAADTAANTGRLPLENLHRSVISTDIAVSAANFHRSATVLGTLEMGYPMVHMAPSWAPLDLANSVPGEARSWQTGTADWASPAKIIELAQRAPQEAERIGMRCVPMPVPRARRSFAALLAEFLKTRLEAALSGPPGDGAGQATPDLPGLDVTVYTQQPGLQIYYAPRYYPATALVFGGTLSTPVRGYLLPRIYIFGAEGPNLPLSFETKAPWKIPPDYTITMLWA